MRRFIVYILLTFLVLGNTASAIASCCLNNENLTVTAEVSDEACHDMVSDADVKETRDHVPQVTQDCQCDSCSHAGFFAKLESLSINASPPTLHLIMPVATALDSIEHPPKHIS